MSDGGSPSGWFPGLLYVVIHAAIIDFRCDGYACSPGDRDGALYTVSVVARRSGNEWYVGCMTNSEARTLTIPLDFLGKGTYDAHIYADAPEADDYPERLVAFNQKVDGKKQVVAKLASGGGYVMHIKIQ